MRHDDAADRIRTAGLAQYGPALFAGATEAEAEQARREVARWAACADEERRIQHAAERGKP